MRSPANSTGQVNGQPPTSRGVDVVMGTCNLLDLVPKGRDKDGLEYDIEWVRTTDRY